MSRNQILIGAVIAALVVLGAIAWYVMGGSPTTTVSAAGAGAPNLTADDRTLGKPEGEDRRHRICRADVPALRAFQRGRHPRPQIAIHRHRKVFYIFRVFPIGQPDVAAESLARCLPADNYFAFIDQLYRNQDKWDPENGVQDVEGGLVGQARIAGMSADQATACMHDKDKNAASWAVSQDAQTRYGISGTPTFVINGEVQTPGAQWPEIKAKLDSLLAKK